MKEVVIHSVEEHLEALMKHSPQQIAAAYEYFKEQEEYTRSIYENLKNLNEAHRRYFEEHNS